MIMPRMSGRDLVQHVHRLHPQLPVHYMSGYSDGQLTDQHLIEEGTELLQKPFTATDLLARSTPRSPPILRPALTRAPSSSRRGAAVDRWGSPARPGRG